MRKKATTFMFLIFCLIRHTSCICLATDHLKALYLLYNNLAARSEQAGKTLLNRALCIPSRQGNPEE